MSVKVGYICRFFFRGKCLCICVALNTWAGLLASAYVLQMTLVFMCLLNQNRHSVSVANILLVWLQVKMPRFSYPSGTGKFAYWGSPGNIFPCQGVADLPRAHSAEPSRTLAQGSVTADPALLHAPCVLNEVWYVFVPSGAFLQKCVTGSKSSMYP